MTKKQLTAKTPTLLDTVIKSNYTYKVDDYILFLDDYFVIFYDSSKYNFKSNLPL